VWKKIYVQVNGCKFNQAQRAEIIGRDGKWEINELFLVTIFNNNNDNNSSNNNN